MIASLPSTMPATSAEVIYPDSDGKPMAENTLQYEWIVLLKENLEVLFEANSAVFVAGDLLWYPVQGHPEIAKAPDVMVIVGRPKGYRGSYKQWEEGDIAPQVVFEVLSPGNTRAEMSNKLVFYHEYGVEEYYSYDPEANDLRGWMRREGILEELDSLQDWVSPRLGIRFNPQMAPLQVYFPNGDRFLSTLEREQLRQQERQRATAAEQRATVAEHRATAAEQRADRLAAKLRELGLDPNSLNGDSV
ncbi:MAG: Uma2 family endonuclease [Prochlorothrix sp.]|nr:Uma2 family endonuclease [Prochlorothrix sp.]